MTNIILREMEPADGAALAALAASTPDSGRITAHVRFHIDPYRTLMAGDDLIGVVAETTDTKSVVGLGAVRFGECRYEGDTLPCARLENLMVHPDHRRQGLATRLMQWRLALAEQHFGADGVIIANIQQGNAGSMAVASKWCDGFSRPVIAAPFRTRSTPPTADDCYAVEDAGERDWEEVAAGLNAFYEHFNFCAPESPESLAHWLRVSSFDTPYHHYVIARDMAGNIVAGLGVSERFKERSIVIRRLPLALRLLNVALRIVPADGVMRELNVTRTWFTPGHVEAARCLFEHVRWRWRTQATSVNAIFDPASPLAQAFVTRPWSPTTSTILAVRGPKPLTPDRLICPT